jgi:Protein of unknown function DUF262/Protein of unknown function (DUF1524)
MGIKPTHKCMETVFGEKYHLDFYQREYKWGKFQVETLLSDILDRFARDYKPDIDPSVRSISQYGWHYLNTFVTNEFDGQQFIVDGQQRLTTLTLILIYLYHRCIADNLPNLPDWLMSKICGSHAEGKTFWMGVGNRESALEVLFSGKDEESRGNSDSDVSCRNIFANYEVLRRVLDDQLRSPHKLHAFVLYFMKCVELVQLHIDDQRDVAMVFEVINDRGEPLKPYEVFKGELLAQLSKLELHEGYYQLWTDSINPLQEKDDKEPDRFFRLLFRSKYTNNRDQYQAFEGDYHRVVFANPWDERLKLKRNHEGVKAFLRDKVTWFAKVYQRVLVLYEKEGSYVYCNGNLNDHDRQYLLIMSAISEQDQDWEMKIELVARLFDRNFSLLRLTGSYDTNEFTESIIALNTAVRNRGLSEIQVAFDQQLLKDIHTVRGVTVDDPFQWSLFKNVGYELGSRFIRYFFSRVEHYICRNAKLPVDGYYNLVRNNGAVQGYHVEHILADNTENRALFEDEETFVRERNRLGGLLLLKGRDNQSSGNESYRDKLRTYSHSTRLGATLTDDFYHRNLDFSDFIQATNLPFNPINLFDHSAIDERHHLYFEIAKRIWGDKSFPKPQ